MAFRGPYVREVGNPMSAMGALGDIELQQRKLDALGGGSPYYSIPKEATLFLGDLIGLFRHPRSEQIAQQATLNEAAEAMGPALAKEQGISLDEAKQQIAGGVQQPEAPYLRAYHALGFGTPPAGESYDERVAKIRGMAQRLGFARQQREEGRKDFAQLMTAASRMRDPSPLAPYIREAATRAGFTDMGDVQLPKKAPGSLWEWAQEQGYTPEEFEHMIHQPPRPTEAEIERQSFLSDDPRVRKWAKLRLSRRGRGGAVRGGDPQLKIYQQLLVEGFKAKRDLIMKDESLSPEEKQARIAQLMKETDDELRRIGIAGTTVDAYQGGGDQGDEGGAPAAPGAGEAEAEPPATDDSDDFLNSLGLGTPTTTRDTGTPTTTGEGTPGTSTTVTPPFRPRTGRPTVEETLQLNYPRPPERYGTGLGGY